MTELIYCADGNPRFAQIAISAGFRYGAQLPNTIYFHPWFADQDWKDPNRSKYIAALAEHRPHIATVLDWEHAEQLPEVLSWAEEAAAYVEQVVIIPKVLGGISQPPRHIGTKPVVLGYSVPTKFAGTDVPVWEFTGWPVHLLGGQPQHQIHLARYLNVTSTDTNYMNKMAVQHCQFWVPGTARGANNRHWPTLREANGGTPVEGDDLPYEAFRRSCDNIMQAWSKPQWPQH